MYYTPLGGAFEVGASCHLIQIADKNILIDSGLRPNRYGNEALPDFAKLKKLIGDKLDLILISHAHIDHTGAIPLLVNLYPTVPIYCTKPTKIITSILLEDTIKIMEQETEEEKAEAPLYSREMVERAIWSLQEVEFNEWFEPIKGIKVYFHPSGHIIGAGSILIDTPESKLIYSGDIATANQHTVDGMIPIDFFQADFLILESTYGDSKHDPRKNQEQKLAQAVSKVIQRGGMVLVPAFALGRAQELILILKSSMLSGLIPKFPIYVDGMVRSICDAYTELVDYLPAKLKNYVKNSHQPIFWTREREGMPGIKKVFKDERILMLSPEPKCIISSSGMLNGGPSVFYAKALAPDEKNAIFLTGYQDEESPGRRLQELKPGDKLMLDGEEVPVECEVHKYNLSAHADQIQLCQQVSYINPKSIALVHGEPVAIQTLRQKLMLKCLVYIAHNGMTIDPLKQPDWLTDHRMQRLDAEQNRYSGKLESDHQQAAIIFGEELVNSPQWRQLFDGYTEVEAKFMGKRLIIKAKVAEEEEEEGEGRKAELNE